MILSHKMTSWGKLEKRHVGGALCNLFLQLLVHSKLFINKSGFFQSFQFIYLFFFLRWSLTVLPSLKCSGGISAHCKLHLLSSTRPPASASWHHRCRTWCPANFNFFCIFVEMEFHYVGQAGLRCLALSDPLSSASQSAGITGLSHHTQPTSYSSGQIFRN